MKPIKVTLHHLALPLKRPFQTSFGKYVIRNTIIVEVEDSSGEVGWGEVAVDEGPWYSYETLKTAMHIIGDFIAPAIIRKELNDPTELQEKIRHVRGHRIAKAGVEDALWDLYSKLLGKPLYKMLGGIRDYVECGVSIGIIGDMDMLIESVGKYLNEGYKRIKIKIKHGWDVDPVKEIRKTYGEIPLQVDANADYDLEDIEVFRELDNYNLIMVEQPLSYDDIYDHSILQSEIKTPVCLDESIKSIYDAKAAIKLGSCRIINVKPPRVGGLLETIKINNYAEKHGVGIWIGGMLETGIGRARLIAAGTLSNVKYPCDISSSSRYYEEDIIEPEWVVRDGIINPLSKAGIGVEVVEERLNKYLVERKVYR